MKREAIIVDLDGTLALRGDRDPYNYDEAMEDAVNDRLVDFLTDYLVESSADLLIVSGREEKSRDVVEYWLWRHGLPEYDGLYLRPTGDNRTDSEVKKEIYTTYIEPYYSVIAVFDDRNSVVKMWRELGLLCLQVADGDF